MAGQREAAGWMVQAGTDHLMGYYDLKGVLEQLMESWRIEAVRYEPTEHPTFQPGRVARLSLASPGAGGATYLGTAGQVHPLVAKQFDMPDGIPVLAAELGLDALMTAVPARFKAEPVPQYPAVYQDIALIVDETVPAAEVLRLILQTGGRLLTQARLFDVYRGEQLPAGKKSLAYALAFQSLERTLTDKEASKLRSKIVRRLEREIGAQLRDR
jgi:phenylalanyl-tRNA synthetase beta chain